MSLLLLTGALAACTTAGPPAQRSASAEAELQQLLAGRVAGQAVSCLPSNRGRSASMIPIDDNTIAFRGNTAGDVYVSNITSGGCSLLGSGFYTLVTRTTASRLCSGDIAQVVDLRNGFTVGSCAIGEFTPYHRS